MKGRIITNTNYNGMEFDFEVYTADLIAELERRRQRHCDCFNYSDDDGAEKCRKCIWDNTPLKDNFTPKSEEPK